MRTCRSVAAGMAVVVAAVLATGGCKGKKPAGGGAPAARDAAVAVVVDGGVAAVDGGGGAGGEGGEGADGPDEAGLRAGKRTGLGAPDEKAEVATEELIEAMVAGTVPWTRWIDPTRGVVMLKLPADAVGAVARRCGAGLTASLDALTTAMKGAATSGLGYALDCDNAGLAGTDPSGAMAAATCSLESEAAGTLIVDLVFVPDAVLGLRLVGISSAPAETDPGAALGDFEAEMARADSRCP
jgi:hypothetical protein